VVTHSATGAIQSTMTGNDGTLYGGADSRRSTSSALGY
jgi:gamma-glutamyltranspeptidase/glutathione hydrolase